MGLSDCSAVVLDQVDVDSIFLDPAVPDIFYIKHHVGASLIIIFIGNPDVSMQ